MNILDMIEALKEPDCYLERGYTRQDVRNLAFSSNYKDTELLGKLFSYAKAKCNPDHEVRRIKERFKKECNDYWCMMSVATAMQRMPFFDNTAIEYAMRDAFRQLDKGIELHETVSYLTSLEVFYRENSH